MISWAMWYLIVNVLIWVCYIWHVDLGCVLSCLWRQIVLYVLPWNPILRKHSFIYYTVPSWYCLVAQHEHFVVCDGGYKILWSIYLNTHLQAVSRSARFSSVKLKWFLYWFGFLITSRLNLHNQWMAFGSSHSYFQLPVLAPNNVIWVTFYAVLFDETQHVVKRSTMGYFFNDWG